MAKRIPKRVREEAALIAAVHASNDVLCSYDEFKATFCVSDEAFDLWAAADRAALFSYGPGGYLMDAGRTVSAEAEALLRTGWMP